MRQTGFVMRLLAAIPFDTARLKCGPSTCPFEGIHIHAKILLFGRELLHEAGNLTRTQADTLSGVHFIETAASY